MENKTKIEILAKNQTHRAPIARSSTIGFLGINDV